MKSMVKCIAAAVVMYVAGATAAVLPRVGSGTEPNQWTSNISGVLSAAKTTNLPILLVMINDSSTGEGCQHCMQFVNNTLNTQNFADIVASYKFYMVLLNTWSAPSEPAYGGVDSSVFDTYFYRYQAGDYGYPQVVVIRPDGTRYTGWSYETRPVSSSGTILYQYMRQAIADLSQSDTQFSLSSQSGNVVTVQAAEQLAGVWTGAITRSGASGKTGTVNISLSGANAARYGLSATSIAWDASDGTKTFTVTGPNAFDDDVVADTLVVTISADGFSGSSISYGTVSQSVTFKDSRVKSTLAEFAASNPGLGGLAAWGGTWFAPSADDGNVLETLAKVDSTLIFTATEGGILTVAAGMSSSQIGVSANGNESVLGAGETKRFGVAAGQQIMFRVYGGGMAGAASAANMPVGFSQFSFSPLSVSLLKPTAGASIPYGAMMSDKSLVDLGWTASIPGSTFVLTCNGVEKDMGGATSGNAIDLGLVSSAVETITYSWGVRASYTDDSLEGVAVGSAAATFTVTTLPEFPVVPASVPVYKSVGAAIDMSVSATGGSTVTYTATGLPPGMRIDGATGIITGTPKRARNYNVTVTAQNANGSASVSFSMNVAKFPSVYAKPKYVLHFFGAQDEIVASAQLKVTSSGKWTAKVVRSGAKTTIRGKVVSQGDGGLATGSSDLNLTYNPATGIWSGTAFGFRVFGKATDKANETWKGAWNIGIASSSSPNLGGWATATVGTTGKISLSGKLYGKTRISGGGDSAVFPADFVATYFPRWAGNGDVRFGNASTKSGVVVGCALFSNGKVCGNASFGGQAFDAVDGSFWNEGIASGLNGLGLCTIGGGNVTIPLAASSSKVSAGENGYSARIRYKSSKGQLNISYSLDGKKYDASGVIYSAGGVPTAFGGGTRGDEKFSFTVR